MSLEENPTKNDEIRKDKTKKNETKQKKKESIESKEIKKKRNIRISSFIDPFCPQSTWH
jgi:hypothetical protein